MQILKGYRGCGKTTYCIKKAYRENAIIVTGSSAMKQCITEQAIQMKMPVTVLSVYDVIAYKMNHGGLVKKKIFIDQLEHVLYSLFNACDIECATTDADVLKPIEWDKEDGNRVLEIRLFNNGKYAHAITFEQFINDFISGEKYEKKKQAKNRNRKD